MILHLLKIAQETSKVMLFLVYLKRSYTMKLTRLPVMHKNFVILRKLILFAPNFLIAKMWLMGPVKCLPVRPEPVPASNLSVLLTWLAPHWAGSLLLASLAGHFPKLGLQAQITAFVVVDSTWSACLQNKGPNSLNQFSLELWPLHQWLLQPHHLCYCKDGRQLLTISLTLKSLANRESARVASTVSHQQRGSGISTLVIIRRIVKKYSWCNYLFPFVTFSQSCLLTTDVWNLS